MERRTEKHYLVVKNIINSEMLVSVALLALCGEKTFSAERGVEDESEQKDCGETVELIDNTIAIDTGEMIELKNSENTTVAYYYQNLYDGYVILDLNGDIVEYSLEDDIEQYNNSEMCYYGGPGSYYYENDDNEIENVENGQLIDIDEISDFESESDTKQSVIERSLPGAYGSSKDIKTVKADCKSIKLIENQHLPYSTRYFSFNTNGTCGSTAAAILLYYYYDHIDRSVIKETYTPTSKAVEFAFVSYLIGIIQPQMDESGSDYLETTNGIRKYFTYNKLDYTCASCRNASTYFTLYKYWIAHGRPCIIGLANDPVYHDHWAVGIGYLIYKITYEDGDTTNKVFIKINNGWGESATSNLVYVNKKYVDGIIYIQK